MCVHIYVHTYTYTYNMHIHVHIGTPKQRAYYSFSLKFQLTDGLYRRARSLPSFIFNCVSGR